MANMSRRLLTVAAVLTGVLAWSASARAQSNGTEGGRFHFDVGLTGITGANKLDTDLRHEAEDNGYSYSSFVWPVGLEVDPYYTFNFGLGLGGSVGPLMLGETSGDISSDFVIVPVGLDARYEFLNNSGVVPYVRAGFRYPITAGDSISNGQIGPFVGAGVIFTKIHLELEAAYDGSKVTTDLGDFGDTKVVEPYQFMFTVAYHF